MAKKIDEDILKPSIERYNSGESVKSISDNIGVSVNTIRRFLKKNGIVFKYSKPKIAYVDANLKSENTITKEFQIQGKSTYEVLSTLYENATIYLDRKFERYQEVCRLYE